MATNCGGWDLGDAVNAYQQGQGVREHPGVRGRHPTRERSERWLGAAWHGAVKLSGTLKRDDVETKHTHRVDAEKQTVEGANRAKGSASYILPQ